MTLHLKELPPTDFIWPGAVLLCCGQGRAATWQNIEFVLIKSTYDGLYNGVLKSVRLAGAEISQKLEARPHLKIIRSTNKLYCKEVLYDRMVETFFVLNRLNSIMKKNTTAPETSVSKAKKTTTTKRTKKTLEKSVPPEVIQTKPEAPVITEAPKAKPEASTKKVIEITPEASITSDAAKAAPKKTSPKPKTTKKAAVVEPESIASSPEISVHERVGLTAGAIWHYLAENGATSVAKLVDALPEEEAIIQRSMGWLAQEDKITLSVVEQIETITLKG
jgi:hypothetical protein